MENVINFITENHLAIRIVSSIGFVLFGYWISTLKPPKKPKSSGSLHVIHYTNGFKELYLELNNEIESFEKNDQVCFDVKNEYVDNK